MTPREVWDEMTPLIEESYVEMYGEEADEPTLAPTTFEMMRPPNGNLIVVEAEGIPVAIGGWTWLDHHRPAAWTEPVAEVRRVFVRKEFRQRGIGKDLNLAIIEDARRHGAGRIVAETGDKQVEAILTYQALGYDAVEPFGEYAKNPTSNFFGMVL